VWHVFQHLQPGLINTSSHCE